MINSWIPGEYISLRKNPLYFRSDEIELKFDQLLFRFVGVDGANNLEALSNGFCDVLDQEASASLMEGEIETLRQLEADGGSQVHISTSPIWEHADFGIRPASYDDGYQPGEDRPDTFADVRTRQAFAMCVDRQEINQEVLFGESVVPGSYLPGDHPLFNPDLARYEFDPGAAVELLEQVGWVDSDGDPTTPRVARGIQGIFDGTPLVITYTTSNALQRQRSSQILADSLAECGIQIELQYGEASEVFAPGPEGPIFGRRFDLAQFAWDSGILPRCELWTSQQISGDPILKDENGLPRYPYGWGGANQTGFSSLDYDQACRTASETLPGQPGFIENHHLSQSIFAEQLPVIPLYQRLKLALARPDMCGFELDPSATSEMWNIEGFDYGTSCP
jgi:peptide/nickel transport system substrate-binding protein